MISKPPHRSRTLWALAALAAVVVCETVYILADGGGVPPGRVLEAVLVIAAGVGRTLAPGPISWRKIRYHAAASEG